jgi:hypothetical protein
VVYDEVWQNDRLVMVMAFLAASASAQQPQKLDILVIMVDEIGYWNISAYNRGKMGCHTPDLDRIANDDRLLRPAILYRRPRRFHYRAEPAGTEGNCIEHGRGLASERQCVC